MPRAPSPTFGVTSRGVASPTTSEGIYPGCPWSALARFFLQDIGLPRVRTGSALRSFRADDFSRSVGSLRTSNPEPSSCGFSIRTSLGLLPPQAPDMLVVQTGQLTTGDFHPIGFAALSAVPLTASASAAWRLWPATVAWKPCPQTRLSLPINGDHLPEVEISTGSSSHTVSPKNVVISVTVASNSM